MMKKWTVFLAACAAIVGGALLMPKIDAIYEAYKYAERERQAITELESGIKNRAIDPDSVKFRHVRIYSMPMPRRPGRYLYTICGQVNAKNRLGGYHGFVNFVANSDDDPQLRFEPDDPGSFAMQEKKSEFERQKVIFNSRLSECPPLVTEQE